MPPLVCFTPRARHPQRSVVWQTAAMRYAVPLAVALAVCSCSQTPPVAECGALTRCASACVDLTSAADHCGACGTACTSGEACVQSKCYPQTCTGTPCTATQICATEHCVERACLGVMCPSSQSCLSGACVSSACSSIDCP